MMRIAVLLTGTVQKLNKYDHIVYPEWFNIHIWIHEENVSLLFNFKHKLCDLTCTFLEPFPILVLAPMYLIYRRTSVRMNCKIMPYVSQNNVKNIFDIYSMDNKSLLPRTLLYLSHLHLFHRELSFFHQLTLMQLEIVLFEIHLPSSTCYEQHLISNKSLL